MRANIEKGPLCGGRLAVRSFPAFSSWVAQLHSGLYSSAVQDSWRGTAAMRSRHVRRTVWSELTRLFPAACLLQTGPSRTEPSPIGSGGDYRVLYYRVSEPASGTQLKPQSAALCLVTLISSIRPFFICFWPMLRNYSAANSTIRQ